ncbi:hypothetical protein BB28_22910 [Mycobacteroides chelonae CCUG 47445]|nr:hypothetical protein BB28_22910 [Mycobacteroides chelonae CCUG 47445]
MAATRVGGARWARTPVDRAVLRVAVRPHRPGLPGRRLRHPVAAAGRCGGQLGGLGRQPDAHSAVRSANTHGGSDTDVEPGGGGRVLHRAACHRAHHAAGTAALACPGTGDGRSRQPRVGVHPLPHHRRHQSVDMATGLLLMVRGGHAAGRVERRTARLDAAPGAPTAAARRGGPRRIRSGRVPIGRPGGPDAGTTASVRRQDRDGCDAGLGAAVAVDAGYPGHAAPDTGQPPDGDTRAMVLWPVHLASGGAEHGLHRDRSLSVQRSLPTGADSDVDLWLRDGRCQLRAGGIPVTRGITALPETARWLSGREPHRGEGHCGHGDQRQQLNPP